MTTFQTLARLSAAIVAALACACIASPYDGETVASNPTTIIPEISGWGTEGGQTVDIYAKNSSGTFVFVTSTNTSSTGWSWSGSNWYTWGLTNYNLPLAYWTDKPGGCGRTATLKAVIGGYNAITVDQPFNDCWDYNMTVSEFLTACESDNSPEVTIDTCGALCC